LKVLDVLDVEIGLPGMKFVGWNEEPSSWQMSDYQIVGIKSSEPEP
jgi:hypothetical protein